VVLANNAGGALQVPFSVTGIATGLTLGVAYWFDLAQALPAGGGNVVLTSITVSATEI
jgi:hypothetical protein